MLAQNNGKAKSSATKVLDMNLQQKEGIKSAVIDNLKKITKLNNSTSIPRSIIPKARTNHDVKATSQDTFRNETKKTTLDDSNREIVSIVRKS